MSIAKKLSIIIIIVVIIFLILAEIDRSRRRHVRPSLHMYYRGHHYLTAPMNLFIKNHLKDEDAAKPFPSMKANFSNHHRIQSCWTGIRDEVLQLYNKEGMSQIKGDLFFTRIADNKWKKFYIKWYSESLKDSRAKLPYTTKLLDSIPEVKSAMISVLEPGAVITPHVGPFRGALRYHLGLSTPQNDNCRILVDGIAYSWRDGEDILFDDTFVHEVRNDTDKPRFILFCDIQRNLDTKFANKTLDTACKAGKVTSRANK